jgi:uncharacterized sporulation protein YeaH/YhbH (DUF444 family)
MTIEAMKQALETFEHLRSHDKRNLYGLDEDITALRTAIEQAERDWSLLEATQESLREHMAEIKRLKQRQWVGLTDEEVEQLAAQVWFGGASAGHERFAKLIEAKLKEKNETT